MKILLVAATTDGRLFGLDQQTLIAIAIQLFNALFLAVVLSFLLYKPVQKALAKRSAKIEKQLSAAAEDQRKAQELKEQYEKKLADIEQERKELIETAKIKAEQQAKQLLATAEKEAQALKKAAKEQIAEEHEEMVEEMRQQIIDVATLMSEKLLKASIDKKTHDDFVNEAILELEDLL